MVEFFKYFVLQQFSHSISGQEIEEVLVDDCGDGEAAAEGAHLALWSYDALKAKKETLKALNIKPLSQEDDTTLWSSGVKKAKGQNFARTLMETPANYMTPTLFAQVRIILIKYFKTQSLVRCIITITTENVMSLS